MKQIDVSQGDVSRQQLGALIKEMGGLDLMLISVSSYIDTKSDFKSLTSKKKTMDVDLRGFWDMADVAVGHFEKQRSGHLVGISSVDGLRGNALCPEYSGAKAFISTYLEGIRNRMIQKNIPVNVTDIVPGWVDIEHTKFSAHPGAYWVSSLDDASRQIYEAIVGEKKKAYITKRWYWIAWLLDVVPDVVYNALGGF